MWKPIAYLFIIIASGFFSMTYVLPEYRNVQELRQNVATLNSVLGDTKMIKMLLDETSSLLGSIPKESEERFSLLIPERIDHLRFANTLKVMASNRGIALRELAVSREDAANSVLAGVKNGGGGLLSNIKDTFTLDPTTRTGSGSLATPKMKEKNYVITRATLSFSATYGAFKVFLGDLEKSLTLINVTDLSFAPRKEGAQKSAVPVYDYTMEVETYSIK